MKPTARYNREQFHEKLKKSLKFVPSKVIIPAMDSLMLTIRNGSTEILATDGRTQIRLTCPTSGKDEMQFCVPAKLFVKTIGLFRENEVIITQKKENVIELKSGKSKYNITLDCFPNSFPEMKMSDIDSEIAMNQYMLGLGLMQSEKFVNDENQNANFVGININEINNNIIFTGVDDAIICRSKIRPISITRWSKISIPTETANKVVSLLDDKGEIGIIHGPGKIMFFTSKEDPNGFEVTSVLADIKFPDSERIFEKRPDSVIVMNTLELTDACRRLKLYSGIGDTPKVHLSNLENSQDVKIVSSDALTGNDGEEIISIVNPEKLIFNKMFNTNYLLKLLSSIEASEVSIYFSEANNIPCFIIPRVATEDLDIFAFSIAPCIF